MIENHNLLIKSMEMSVEGQYFIMKMETDRNSMKGHDFRCCIYADDYFLMCTDAEENAPKVRRGTVRLKMQSRFPWLAGHYKLHFSLAESLMGVMEFQVDEQQDVEIQAINAYGIFDPDDIAMSFLANDTAWGVLATLPGTKELRLATIEANRMRLWAGCLHLNVKDSVRQPSGYVFINKGKENPLPAIRCFFDELYTKSSLELADSTTLYDTTLQNPMDRFNQLLNETEAGKTICLDHVGALTGTGGRLIIQQLSNAVRNKRYGLWLSGSCQEVEALFNMYPSLREFFPESKRLTLLPPTPTEMVHSFFSEMTAWDLHPSEDVSRQLMAAVRKGCDDGTIANWTRADINRFYQEHVMKAYLRRLADTAQSFDKDELKADDIDFTQLYGRLSGYEESLQELNQMVGLDNIKKSITTIAHQVRIFAERRQQGLPTNTKDVFHAVFTGSPGTGKTTVAKMLGRIYHQLGLLSKGEVICVDRSRIVGRFIGDTEDNVKNLLREAQGNVLFIDEAYSLYSSEGTNDYGRRAVESLLTSLSEKNPDMLVIFAGYKEEMDRLMTMNPGLHDRFPYKFHFADYTAAQLMLIAEHIFQQDQYLLAKDARDELQLSIEKALQHRSSHFGNARWVEQFVRNGIIPALADRLADTKSHRPLVREDYQRVLVSDVKAAYELFAPSTVELKPRLRVVGFGT